MGLRLYCLREQTGFPVRRYITEVLFAALKVAALSVVVPIVLNMVWADSHIGIVIAKIIIMEMVAVAMVLAFGLNGREREFVFSTVKKKLFKTTT